MYAASRATNTSVVVEAIQNGTGADTPIQLTAGGPNDGTPREATALYGKLSDAPPIDPSWDYYDCAVPYMVKASEIGGFLCKQESDNGHPVNPIANRDGTYLSPYSDVYCGGIGSRGGDSYLNVIDRFRSRIQRDADGVDTITIDGTLYYFNAIQFYFYPDGYTFNYATGGSRNGHPIGGDPTNYDEYNYYNWGTVDGEIFDFILTDGTVIHSIATDANSASHTNHGMQFGGWDAAHKCMFRLTELKMPQYACLYSCVQRTIGELAGDGSRDYLNPWLRRFNIDNTSPDGVRVAYVRMYDKTIYDITN